MTTETAPFLLRFHHVNGERGTGIYQAARPGIPRSVCYTSTGSLDFVYT